MKKGLITLLAAFVTIFSLMLLAFSIDEAAAKRKKITLKGGTPWGEKHSSSLNLSYFSKRLEELSNGDITVKKFFGGSLVTGRTELDCLKNEIVDISTIVAPYHPGAVPKVIRLIQTVPFVADFNSLAWMLDNTDWHTKHLKDLGIHFLFPFYGEQCLFLAKPLEDIIHPDLSGRKIRAPGLGWSEFIKTLGGDVVTMPSGEVPAAVATGLCSGAYTSLDTWENIGIQETCPYAYIHTLPYAMLECMTESRYKSLPDWAQKLIDQAAEDTAKAALEWALGYRKTILEKYKGHPKVQITVLNEKQQEAWITRLKPFFDWMHKEFDPDISLYFQDCQKAWRATHTTPPLTIE